MWHITMRSGDAISLFSPIYRLEVVSVAALQVGRDTRKSISRLRRLLLLLLRTGGRGVRQAMDLVRGEDGDNSY